MHYSTLPEALDELSGLDRSIRLINRSGAESLTGFAGLRSRALKLLHHFQSRGAGAGDEMLLVLNRNDAFLDAYWACLYGGIVPVPLAPGTTDAQRRKIFQVAASLRSPWLFTEHALDGRLAGFAAEQGFEATRQRLRGRTTLVEAVGETGAEGSVELRGAEDTAFIQFSSGSTSDPKGVVLSHGNLLANIRDMIATAGLEDSDRGLSWMPLTHDMGLIGFHLMMVLAGMEHTIIATDAFIRRPLRWIQAASEHRASVLCSPNFGYRYLLKSFSPDKAGDIDLSAVRIIFNGAEPISAPLCEEFLDTLAPLGLRRSAMYPVYGLAEASLAVSFPPPGQLYHTLTVDRGSLGYGDRIRLDECDNPVTLVNVGRAIGECELRIGDDRGEDLGADTVGRILIRGPNVTRGFYVDGTRLSREAFRGDGWLDTGDLGFLHQGDLYITGRTKDVIFVNGQNWYAHDIEAVAAQAEGTELGKVVAAGAANRDNGVDEMILFILHRGDPGEFPQRARAAAARVNEQTGAPVSVAVPVTGIPKTTSGKLQRFSLQKEYEQGGFDDVALRLSPGGGDDGEPGGGSEAESFLQELCAEMLDGIHVGLHDSLFDIGISSLKMIEIHERIDERYPGRIEVTDLFDHPTLAALAGRLESRREERA
ncbi:MAG TPA: non-ribosomal peptide synthetase [Arenicellales bacterium]|nr:non-ribosomal peptide synthetase [Arenicellales bacterium]